MSNVGNGTNDTAFSGAANQTNGTTGSPPDSAAEEEDFWEQHGWWVVLCLAGSSGILGVGHGMRSWHSQTRALNGESGTEADNVFDGVVCETGGEDGSRLVKFLADEMEKRRAGGGSFVAQSVASVSTAQPSPTASNSLSVASEGVLQGGGGVVSVSSSTRQSSSGPVEDHPASTSSVVVTSMPDSGMGATMSSSRRRASVCSVASASRRNSISSLVDGDDADEETNVVVLAKKFRVQVHGQHTASSGTSRIVFGRNQHDRQRVAVKLFRSERDFERELDFLMELQEPTKVIPLCDRPIYGLPSEVAEHEITEHASDGGAEDDKRRENLALFFPEFSAGGLVLQRAERNMLEFVETMGRELTLHEALLWGQQMVASLAWIHSREVVWADCKLANYLLVLEPGAVLPVLKACDFGTSMFYGEVFSTFSPPEQINDRAQEEPSSVWDWWTSSGALMTARGGVVTGEQEQAPNETTGVRSDLARFGVTPQYAPPERVAAFYAKKNKNLKAHSSYDIWALGVCLYRILAGTDLFASESEAWDKLQQCVLEPNLFRSQFLEEKLIKNCNESAARLLKDMLTVKCALRPTANNVLGRALFRGGSTLNVSNLYSRMKSGFTKLEAKVDRAAEAVRISPPISSPSGPPKLSQAYSLLAGVRWELFSRALSHLPFPFSFSFSLKGGVECLPPPPTPPCRF